MRRRGNRSLTPISRRLFFALWPNETTREAVRRESRAVVRHCGGKPVAPGNLHMTLVFLGNVPDERVEVLCTAARLLKSPAFDLILDRYGWFEKAQVLWLGCSDPPAPLHKLAGELGALCVNLAGVPMDLRPFHPHVTLARKVRNPPEFKAPPALTWPANGFALVESQTHPDGARYQIISEFAAH